MHPQDTESVMDRQGSLGLGLMGRVFVCAAGWSCAVRYSMDSGYYCSEEDIFLSFDTIWGQWEYVMETNVHERKVQGTLVREHLSSVKSQRKEQMSASRYTLGKCQGLAMCLDVRSTL